MYKHIVNFLLVLKNYSRFKKFIYKSYNFFKKTKNYKNSVLIVLQPWSYTPLPYYLINLGISLEKRGSNVKYIIDDLESISSSPLIKLELFLIKKILKNNFSSKNYYKLSQVKTENNFIDDDIINDLVLKNKTIKYRKENSENQNFERYVFNNLKNNSNNILSFLKVNTFDKVVLGGGGYGSSGLWVSALVKNNINFFTIDSGKSLILGCNNGIAANLDDISVAFKKIKKSDTDFINGIAKNELSKRLKGEDHFKYQKKKSGKKHDIGVVLVLNQSYDLSALNRHYVFKNQTDWIIQTIDWVLKNTNEKIAIRRHPVESNPIYRSSDKYDEVIFHKFSSKRIYYFDSSHEVNTYDLIENCKVLIPYISTVGNEAAALGKAVVTEGKSCYSQLGFVQLAKSKEIYFELLKETLNNKFKLNNNQLNDALKCYYLTQCCNWLHTLVTPQQNDFDKWIKLKNNDILVLDDFKILLEAIEKNSPISYLRHLRNINLNTDESN